MTIILNFHLSKVQSKNIHTKRTIQSIWVVLIKNRSIFAKAWPLWNQNQNDESSRKYFGEYPNKRCVCVFKWSAHLIKGKLDNNSIVIIIFHYYIIIRLFLCSCERFENGPFEIPWWDARVSFDFFKVDGFIRAFICEKTFIKKKCSDNKCIWHQSSFDLVRSAPRNTKETAKYARTFVNKNNMTNAFERGKNPIEEQWTQNMSYTL